MFRQAIARPVTTANRLAVGNRSFSVFAPRMTDDTGAPKSTATQQSYVLFFSSYSLINTVSIFPISLQFSGYGYSVQRCKRRMTSCKSPHQQQSMLTRSLTSDAFSRREAAQENVYIHEKEREKYVPFHFPTIPLVRPRC